MSKKALKLVKKAFKKHVVDTHSNFGDDTIVIERDVIRDVAEHLKNEGKLAFEMMVDVTVVDYLGHRPDDERFEVVYHFLSLTHLHRLRVKAKLPADDPTIDTISDIYASANWGEREAYDMYGVRFNGHPDLRRILLYEEFEGFPLRKDYDIHGSQPRVDLLELERPTTNMYSPNYGEYGPEKENR